MAIYTFFRQPAAGEKKFGFFWVQMAIYTFFRQPCKRKNNLGFFGGQMVIYTFLRQPAAGEKKFEVFWGTKWCNIYTFCTTLFFVLRPIFLFRSFVLCPIFLCPILCPLSSDLWCIWGRGYSATLLLNSLKIDKQNSKTCDKNTNFRVLLF
jgi:hypothetical protein